MQMDIRCSTRGNWSVIRPWGRWCRLTWGDHRRLLREELRRPVRQVDINPWAIIILFHHKFGSMAGCVDGLYSFCERAEGVDAGNSFRTPAIARLDNKRIWKLDLLSDSESFIQTRRTVGFVTDKLACQEHIGGSSTKRFWRCGFHSNLGGDLSNVISKRVSKSDYSIHRFSICPDRCKNAFTNISPGGFINRVGINASRQCAYFGSLSQRPGLSSTTTLILRSMAAR
jgi:hypothetical protein